MKIGIFIDNYYDTQRQKDPGVIADYLASFGHSVTVYCYATDSAKSDSVKKISKQQSNSADFWKRENVDYIIIYSWLSLRFSQMIESLKQTQKKIILKLDSDGRLLYPFKPTYLRTLGRDNSLKQLAIHIVRLVQWHILFKNISLRKLKQLELADAYIIESPRALDNLRKSLNRLNRSALIPRSHFIANPINIQPSKGLLKERENKIICVGRWNDKQKNAAGLRRVLKTINFNDWTVEIIGEGAKEIKEYLSAYQEADKIIAVPAVEHQLISKHYETAKIFFCPSYFESFNLAAAEALACGCSLAGSPLESFHYFCDDDRFGTLSDNFKAESLKKALQTELIRWNEGRYRPEEIADYWRNKLSPETTTREIETILMKLN